MGNGIKDPQEATASDAASGVVLTDCLMPPYEDHYERLREEYEDYSIESSEEGSIFIDKLTARFGGDLQETLKYLKWKIDQQKQAFEMPNFAPYELAIDLKKANWLHRNDALRNLHSRLYHSARAKSNDRWAMDRTYKGNQLLLQVHGRPFVASYIEQEIWEKHGMVPNSQACLAIRYGKAQKFTLLFLPLGKIFISLSNEDVDTGLMLVSEILTKGDNKGQAGSLHVIFPSEPRCYDEFEDVCYESTKISEEASSSLREFQENLGFTVARIGPGFTLADVQHSKHPSARSKEMEMTILWNSPVIAVETGSAIEGKPSFPVPLFSIVNNVADLS